jgi:hypothetical protein
MKRTINSYETELNEYLASINAEVVEDAFKDTEEGHVEFRMMSSNNGFIVVVLQYVNNDGHIELDEYNIFNK